jgi:hypothetical protein
MKPFSSEELELIWEALYYQIGSLEYLAKKDPLRKLGPPGIEKLEADFAERISRLKALASEIEERLIEQGENP